MDVSLEECRKKSNIATDAEFCSSDDEPLSVYCRRRNEKEITGAAIDDNPTRVKKRGINKHKEAKPRRQGEEQYSSPHTKVNTETDAEICSSDDEPLSEYCKRRNEKEVIGAAKDNHPTRAKQQGINKPKEAKTRRQREEQDSSSHVKLSVPAQKVRPACNHYYRGNCCRDFSDAHCEQIRLDCHSLGDQEKSEEEKKETKRKYVLKYLKREFKKNSTTEGESRRTYTIHYSLPHDHQKKKQVCKKMCLNTLSISEKFARQALSEQQRSGEMKKDKRGGRQKTNAVKDAEKRNIIEEHIKRYPRVNSNCSEKYINKECLCLTLNVTEMYSKFKTETSQSISYSLYRKVYKELNLSFYRPCSLCKQITIKKEE